MNNRLKYLYTEDQKERKNSGEWGKSIAIEDVDARDALRLKETLSIIENDGLKEGVDYYHAAMILQHGDKPTHYKLANELCKKAMDLGEDRAKWLYAATLDRYLLSSGEKYQKYGTQYKTNEDGLWEWCPTDPATTDEERAKYNVPTKAELEERVKELE